MVVGISVSAHGFVFDNRCGVTDTPSTAVIFGCALSFESVQPSWLTSPPIHQRRHTCLPNHVVLPDFLQICPGGQRGLGSNSPDSLAHARRDMGFLCY